MSVIPFPTRSLPRPAMRDPRAIVQRMAEDCIRGRALHEGAHWSHEQLTRFAGVAQGIASEARRRAIRGTAPTALDAVGEIVAEGWALATGSAA